MVDRLEVDLIVNAISEGFEKITSDFQRSGEAVKSAGDEAKASGMKWTEMKSQIDLAAGAANKFLELGQQLFEFGREGAMFAQTEQSFEGLIDQLGITTPLMEEMRKSSMNTVDDMTLMSSALTLVAGAGDELSRELLEATPRLAEIAKAANKLNPSLGDTAFLMDSLGLGIKRASPMILDNLGLTIKLGAANEAMAEKLGKTVDQLTAEEKQMAILNATIEAGDRLIAQAGGSVESATDSYDRLTTAWTNLTDHIKAAASPAIADVVQQIYNLIEGWENFKNIATSSDVFQAESWQEYKQNMLDAAEANGQLTGQYGHYTRQAIEAATHTVTLADGITILGEKEFELRQGMLEGAQITGEAMQAWVDADRAARAMAEGTDQATMSTQEINQAMKDLTLYMSGPLGSEIESFTEKQATLESKMEDVRVKIEELNAMEHLTAEQQAELDKLQGNYDTLSQKYGENATAHDEAMKRIMFNILQQRAAMDGLTQQEVQQLNDIALKWGIVDQATYDYVQKVDAYWASMSASAQKSGDIVQSEIMELLRLQSLVNTDVTIRYRIIVDGKIPNTPRKGDPYIADPPQGSGYNPPYVPDDGGGGSGGSGGYGFYQHGVKDFIVPPGYRNDGFRMGVSSGERVTVQTQAQANGAQFAGGGGVVYNIYPQYSSYTDENQLGRDIKMLEMLRNG